MKKIKYLVNNPRFTIFYYHHDYLADRKQHRFYYCNVTQKPFKSCFYFIYFLFYFLQKGNFS